MPAMRLGKFVFVIPALVLTSRSWGAEVGPEAPKRFFEFFTATLTSQIAITPTPAYGDAWTRKIVRCEKEASKEIAISGSQPISNPGHRAVLFHHRWPWYPL